MELSLTEHGETQWQAPRRRTFSQPLAQTGRFLGRQLIDTWQAVVGDVKSTRGKQGCFWFFYLMWVIALTTILIYLFVWGTEHQNLTKACSPSGDFSQYNDNFSWFSLDGYFQVTFAFGYLSFTQAKILDIAWAVVVGRGGQLFITVASWEVFSNYVATSMATLPATFSTFWIIFLQKENSLLSTYRLMQDLKRHRSLSSTIAKLFIVGTIVFAMAFSTLASAMTGYNTVIKAFIKDASGSLRQFSDFSNIAYIIHDGKRIGLTDNYFVTFPRYLKFTDPLILDHGKAPGSMSSCLDSIDNYDGDDNDDHRCSLLVRVSHYVSQYGFYGLNDTESTFFDQKLEAPALNISGFFFIDSPQAQFGYNWQDPRTTAYVFRNVSNIAYHAEDDSAVYTRQYIEESGSCQPVSENSNDFEYQWGFSFMQLLILMELVWIWTVGIGLMSLNCQAKLPLRNESGEPIDLMRGWRGIIQLADSIKEELKAIDIDPTKLTDLELESKIQKLLNGGSIGLHGSLSAAKFSFWVSFVKWCAEEKWWIAFLVSGCSAQIAAMVIWSIPSGAFFMAGTFLGIIFALFVGTSFKSRIFFVTNGVILGIVIGMVLFYENQPFY